MATYHPGDVVSTRLDGLDVHDPGPPITMTKSDKGVRPHPFIVFETRPDERAIIGVVIRTFEGETSLTRVPRLNVNDYKWYLPVIPAPKESIHDPIPTRPGRQPKPEWVRLIQVMISEDDVRSRFLCSYLFE